MTVCELKQIIAVTGQCNTFLTAKQLEKCQKEERTVFKIRIGFNLILQFKLNIMNIIRFLSVISLSSHIT